MVATWFIHSSDSGYTQSGVDPLVTGLLVYAFLSLPGQGILLFIIQVPVWMYLLFFAGISIFGLGRSLGQPGFVSHATAALAGLAWGLLLNLNTLVNDPLKPLIVLVSIIAFSYYFMRKAEFRHLLSYRSQNTGAASKTADSEEIDRLLDKISKSGVDSLTKAERKRLDDASKDHH